jgi:2-C-methyl-D-erythritol 4-phosphate cytidylyltransferase
MGFDKLTAPLAGVPVLVRTVRAFLDCPVISQVIVVTSEERRDLLAEHGLLHRCEVLPGGAERHHSVWAGLQQSKAPYVAVHDGARPLVTSQLIQATLDVASQCGAAAAGRRISDTLKRVNEENQVIESVDRTNLWAMETPQTFELKLLRDAYQKVLADGLLVTDEVSAIQLLGRAVTMVEAGSPNPKLTFPDDFPLAERLLG